LSLQIPEHDPEDEKDYPFFGDHTYNETYEATDDAKYETVPSSEK